jgi:hypothetical protein
MFCESLFHEEGISLLAPTNRAAERTALPYVVIA